MAKDISCSELIIEVGRKCNLCCEHCLRGDAENKTIDVALAKKFLKEFDEIDCITFTGGEPTLYEKEIIQIIDFILKKKISVHGFYVASNGLIKAPKLMLKLAELYAYVTENYMENYSKFELSNDDFHDDVPEENKSFFKAFAFYSERPRAGWSDSWIPEGRAIWSGLEASFPVNYEQSFDIDVFDNGGIFVNMVYLNAEGYVLPDCNYSYESQREMNPFAYGSMPLKQILKTYNQTSATDSVA